MSWNKNEAGTENIGGTLPNQEKENQLAKVFGDQGTNGLEHLRWNKNEVGTENNGGTLTNLLKRMNEGNNGNHMNENAEDPGQGQVLGLQHFSQDAGQTTSDLMKADKMADEREQEMENTEGESGIGGTRSMNDNRVQSMNAGGGQANEQGGEMLPADVTWKIIEMMKRAAKFRQESESIFLQVGRDLASNGFTGNYQPEIHQNLGSGSGGLFGKAQNIERRREQRYLDKTGEKLTKFLGGNDHKWVKHTETRSKPSNHRK